VCGLGLVLHRDIVAGLRAIKAVEVSVHMCMHKDKHINGYTREYRYVYIYIYIYMCICIFSAPVPGRVNN
jgi:hypothetical protein